MKDARNVCFYSAKKGERLRRSPFLLCPVSGIVDAEFKHGNHKRVTPVNPLGVLGKAVCLVQSVTIPSPIEIVVLCRHLRLACWISCEIKRQMIS